ncbi:MAG TPA: cyclase family protein [Terriglobales bacterium]|nr:cyclase family protein [Terriglobales bacterium]
MKWKTFVIGYALALAVLVFARQHTSPTHSSGFTTVLDLTHAVGGNTPGYEPKEKSGLRVKTIATPGKNGYLAREITLPEHFGAHIDAPAHLANGLWAVNKIPAERLVAPLVVLDVRANVEKNPDYQVSIDDIAAWEKANGQIPQGAVVIARTGWESHWNSVKNYRNADAKGVMHFPGYSTEAARFLVEGRNTIGLGIDTLSIDYGPSKDFPVHEYTLSHSLYHLENVANLGPVPEAGAMVVVAPMKLEGGSGGPVRIFALAK